jgi:hypothetical protein
MNQRMIDGVEVEMSSGNVFAFYLMEKLLNVVDRKVPLRQLDVALRQAQGDRGGKRRVTPSCHGEPVEP